MYLFVFCILIGQTLAGFRASGRIWYSSWRTVGSQAVGRAVGRSGHCLFAIACAMLPINS